MKKFYTLLSYLLSVVVVSIVIYTSYKSTKPIQVIHSNYAHIPLPIALEKTNDTISKMLIRKKQNSCELITQSGDTWFFAEPADMVLWQKENRPTQKIYMWVYTIDTNRWLDAKIAWFSIREKTVLGYGFGAREYKCKDCISYKEMHKRVLHNETLLNPRIRKRLLEDVYEK